MMKLVCGGEARRYSAFFRDHIQFHICTSGYSVNVIRHAVRLRVSHSLRRSDLKIRLVQHRVGAQNMEYKRGRQMILPALSADGVRTRTRRP